MSRTIRPARRLAETVIDLDGALIVRVPARLTFASRRALVEARQRRAERQRREAHQREWAPYASQHD